ncbi:FAD dependent oxidoreductase [Ancylobacter novellus DSM 506]|uniref:FAD dependent oxidoreductase n=1 Tax=Ancylobacter novellus (strain ATCC 8093 / DSM 506 / JCM 20403 / CCM 1077 / IAM 12100 / NBRC 12443 / NCIMB 10456) TaxID=639283 RepID=D7A8L7_ANCN5|nr:FAD-binding oxidoreductase [Ancylobacter novellus]ADH90551.1 FAD dependent oxidoreductase [Ancylobacter novellus DSM 506]
MDETFDVLIVGGAIMGATAAYFLTLDPAFRGRVAVVERDPTFTYSSTTLSAASLRQQFSIPENIRMSLFGLEFLRSARERFGDVDLAWHEGGYLILASEAGLPILKANHRVQQAEGADIALLDPAAMKREFPWLNVEDLAAGAYGRSGEGWFDAHALLQAVRAAAKAQGAHFITGEVVGLAREGDRVTGATLADGRRIGCGALVNAAGPRGGRLAAMAGIELPVEGKKRCVFVVHCRTEIPKLPLLVDPTGFYIRPEGAYQICGAPPAADNDPDADGDFEVDWSIFEEGIWPALAHRIPAMEELKVIRAWAGHYEMNLLDHNAVIGPHPEVANFYFMNGFSGHGLQQAPAAGRAIAEWIVHGRSVSLDLDVFSYERIAAGRPHAELNII